MSAVPSQHSSIICHLFHLSLFLICFKFFSVSSVLHYLSSVSAFSPLDITSWSSQTHFAAAADSCRNQEQRRSIFSTREDVILAVNLKKDYNDTLKDDNDAEKDDNDAEKDDNDTDDLKVVWMIMLPLSSLVVPCKTDEDAKRYYQLDKS